MRVEDLFGYLTYTIPQAETDTVGYARLMILYGDNGSGKTTILTLLFSLLSPVSGRGEKTYVARTPFRLFEVLFDSGLKVTVRKTKGLVGPYTIRFEHPNSEPKIFEVEPDQTVAVKRTPKAIKLLAYLATLGISMYFLPDDRNVRISTEAEGDGDVDEVVVEEEDYVTSTRRVSVRSPDRRTESHHLQLDSVLAKLSSWFRSHAFLGSSAGEENATNIYLNVVENLAQWAAGTPGTGQDQLIIRLERLETRIDRFTRFGLITPFPAKKFIELFCSAQTATKYTIGTIIEPYINGIEARLNALDQVRDLIRTYVETINEFLSGKTIDFSLQLGVLVAGREGGKLDPNLLSSGEKQLILLLSNTILARESAAIFLIDEPELSLNIKWQRSLVEALLRCSEGSKIQFVLASHSLELITQHRRNAVQLISASGIPRGPNA